MVEAVGSADDDDFSGWQRLSRYPLVRGDGTVGEDLVDLKSRRRSASFLVGEKPQVQQVELRPMVFGGGTNDAVGGRLGRFCWYTVGHGVVPDTENRPLPS